MGEHFLITYSTRLFKNIERGEKVDNLRDRLGNERSLSEIQASIFEEKQLQSGSFLPLSTFFKQPLQIYIDF